LVALPEDYSQPRYNPADKSVMEFTIISAAAEIHQGAGT
jgi:hypothetical protein